MKASSPQEHQSGHHPGNGSTDGPAPHEDLTIAEHIASMRLSDEHRPGEQCFRNEQGEKRWVAESEVARFIRKHGAEHPSNFLSLYGHGWQENFFSGL